MQRRITIAPPCIIRLAPAGSTFLKKTLRDEVGAFWLPMFIRHWHVTLPSLCAMALAIRSKPYGELWVTGERHNPSIMRIAQVQWSGSLSKDHGRLTVAFGRGADIDRPAAPIASEAYDPNQSKVAAKSRSAASP